MAELDTAIARTGSAFAVSEQDHQARFADSVQNQLQGIAEQQGRIDDNFEILVPENRPNGPRLGRQRYYDGEAEKHTAARRVLCLFSTFDFLFSVLMWLICTMTMGDNIHHAFREQVINYRVQTSLADLVLAAFLRFTLICFTYGLCGIKHWFIVACTTAASSGFLLTKVFYFDWIDSSNVTFTVMFIICSFIISWIEAWMLDFKQLMDEHRYMQYDIERASLLYNSGVRSAARRSHYGTANVTNPNSTFYSPADSPEGSGSDSDLQLHESTRNYTEEELELKEKGMNSLEVAYKMVHMSGWQIENSSGDKTAVVYGLNVLSVGKIYKLITTVAVPAKILFKDLFFNIESSPNWNANISHCKVLQRIDECSDVIHQISSEKASAIVTQRDFVDLRYWERRGDGYVSCLVSITHPLMPKNPQFVRGENGPGVMMIRPLHDNPRHCVLTLVVDTNLKGWLPQYLIDQTMGGVLLQFAECLRRHAEDDLLPRLQQPS